MSVNSTSSGVTGTSGAPLALDGADITTPTAMPAGGSGIRGWLSAIWTKLNGSLAVTGTFWQTTQPVSSAQLPAALAAGGGLKVEGIAGGVAQPVSIASMPSTPVTGTFFQATQPVSAASLPLPAGAATETTAAAINATLTAGTVQLAAGTAVGATPSTRALQMAGSDYAGTPLARVPKIDSAGLQHFNIASSQGNIAAVSGSLTAIAADVQGTVTTVSTTGQVIANVAASGNCTFHVLATAFVGTVVFEASLNGGANYAPILCIREDGTGSETSAAISTAAAFIRTYTAGLPGFTHFRVRCSAFSSGTLAVYITQGPFLLEPNPTLAAGYALIGQVQQRGADLAVSTLSAANTIATATIPLVAGQFHYITCIEVIRLNPTATAVAAAASLLSISTTNLPGTLAWSIGNAIAAGGYDVPVRLTPNNPIKSLVAGTATTVVTPAGGAGVQFRINLYYYTGA